MSISLTCPGCEKALKVKDELSGRKIKCPECGEIVLVKAALEPVEVPEDEQEEEQPRKKKKKKKKKQQQMNKTLLIAGIVGGLFVLVGGGAAYYMLSGPTIPPQPKQLMVEVKPDPPKLNAQGVQDPQKANKRVSNSIYARGTQLPDARALMVNVGIAYYGFATQNGHGPTKLDELAPGYENNARINEAIKQGWIIVAWGAPLPVLNSNTIIAYECAPDPDNRRIAVFGDGHVDDVFENEFDKMPRADKK